MDRSELKAEIARKGITYRFIAAELHISEQAFYNKLNGDTEFKESEIKTLVRVLGLTPSRVNEIFLF